MQHTLDQIVIVPRNGYANRLQAWASAAIMGAQLEVPVRVAWEPETIAPAGAMDLFCPSAVTRTFLDPDSLTALVGCRHQGLPRYLSVDSARRLIVLAGHDRGEQAFMGDLVTALADECSPTTLVLIAGGKFRLGSDGDFARQRAAFYGRLPWRQEIDAAVEAACADRLEFVGLHVRGTDRSREAPPPHKIRKALGLLREVGPTSLFIAADSEEARAHWTDETRELGFEPWSRVAITRDRTLVAEGFDAVTDWRILGRSQGMVFTAASSFGEEAAVSTGRPLDSIALSASPARQRARAAGDWVVAAATYPARRLRRR